MHETPEKQPGTEVSPAESTKVCRFCGETHGDEGEGLCPAEAAELGRDDG
jgi:hypothetical protein